MENGLKGWNMTENVGEKISDIQTGGGSSWLEPSQRTLGFTPRLLSEPLFSIQPYTHTHTQPPRTFFSIFILMQSEGSPRVKLGAFIHSELGTTGNRCPQSASVHTADDTASNK